MPFVPFTRAIHFRAGLPILPGRAPLLGHIPSLYVDALETFRRGQELLGPLFWIENGTGQWLAMCTAREAFDVLRSKSATTTHFKQGAPALFGESMFGRDGAAHQQSRSALNAPFTPRGLAAAGIGARIAELVAARADRWARLRTVTVLHETEDLALSIVFQLLGVEADDLNDWKARYRDFVFSVIPDMPTWIPGSPTRRARSGRAWLEARLRDIVTAQRERPTPGSFISELANGRDEAGHALTDRELIDNLLFFTLAGHETSASVMAWLVVTLARRPDLWDALCKEATSRNGLPTTPQALRDTPFAEALVRESVRMYPPASFTARMLTEPMTLCGHPLPAGTPVGIALVSLGRDPELYPNPDRFDPARWLGRREPPTPIESCQFGGGPHFCLGYHLAMIEMVQFATALAQRMARDGLRPRMPDGPGPRHHWLPLGHPSRRTKVDFS